jgi:hypothetical protein
MRWIQTPRPMLREGDPPRRLAAAAVAPHGRGRALLGCAALLLSLAACALLAGHGAHAATDPPRYGKRLVAEYALPSELVARYAQFKAGRPIPGESAIVNALLADTLDWVGPDIKLDAGRNPYTIALAVTGHALADGDVGSMWQVGWELRGADGGKAKRLGVLPRIARIGARAGEPLTISAAGAPVSFKENRDAAVSVGFAYARNLSISGVTVQLWSGVPEAGWREWLFSLQALLVGLVMLALVWWFRRR